MMTALKKWTIAVVCLLMLPALSEAGYKKEYKLSCVVGPKMPWGEGATLFADLVRERTEGRVNIKVYTAGSLMAGKQTNEFLLLKRGVADFAFASPINWSSTLKPLNLFNLPFFFEDYAALDKVTAGEAGKAIEAMIAKKGVTVLGWGENGYREITNSKRAIKTPADLKGLKVRVVGTPIFIDIMKSMGANPVNMNWGEAKIAFQQGVVDAQENPAVGIEIPLKIWQFHNHVSFWGYVIDPLMFTVNQKTWKKFSEKDRVIIRQAAVDAGRMQKAVVRKGLVAPDLSAHELMRENGMEVTVLSPEEKTAFRSLTEPVYKKWVPRIGEELVEKAKADMGN
ncbi:TRAP transporter substrate-binding protein DctP [Desulfoluna spongiiphila]|uniref:TRAP transporter substrate-binding protein DctP n=1 Tax=Desulfoluna spongiiphila TaxID=419481 RepID=UPI0012599C64|nr:TRAP transporter substrate-binding protein DctP [Desulfoluna spongiiphila]VVS91810.1 trap transporter solute receptor dctp/teaa [Desulfoluna spongiiphila]